MQLIVMKSLCLSGCRLTPQSFTLRQRLGGTLFFSEQMTTQDLQPIHLRKSMTIPQRRILLPA
jgi:hypothetical protein